MEKKKNMIALSIIPLIIALLFSGYFVWNYADPAVSCASCHEIGRSVETSLNSSHRDIECAQCHGTALSNGLHSINEKLNMLFTHFGNDQKNEDLGLKEVQIIEILENCKNCHRTQFADWKSSGHSVSYGKIFLNDKHNKIEQPSWDCFRCHGMFYEGNIYDLMEPIDNIGPWIIKDSTQINLPAIPCLTCHQIHSKNENRKPAKAFDKPRDIFYHREIRSIPFGMYLRADNMFLRADYLSSPKIFKKGKTIKTSSDYSYRLCVQCHSPNYRHEAGSQDDRTPTGVHEGLDCNSCHKAHSNDAKPLCSNCHPAISNCGLDVTTMNTSYYSAESSNNIHFVDCIDCHPKNKF